MLANTNYNNAYSPNFGAKNASIRKADKISRLVNKEFPTISSSKLVNYKSINKTKQSKNTLEYIGDMISNLRDYYLSNNLEETQIKLLMGLKKIKIGNCFEKTHATNIALKMNGYKDVKTVSLYALNTKTGKIRDLDHIVSAINMDLPKNYKYWDGREKISKENFIKPNKKTILVDTWAGIVDNITSMQAHYKSDIRLDRKLNPDEKLVFLAGDSVELSKDNLDYFKLKYPNLLLKHDKSAQLNKGVLNDSRYNLSEMSDYVIKSVKKEHHIGDKNNPKENSYSIWSTIMSIFCDSNSLV